MLNGARSPFTSKELNRGDCRLHMPPHDISSHISYACAVWHAYGRGGGGLRKKTKILLQCCESGMCSSSARYYTGSRAPAEPSHQPLNAITWESRCRISVCCVLCASIFIALSAYVANNLKQIAQNRITKCAPLH